MPSFGLQVGWVDAFPECLAVFLVLTATLPHARWFRDEFRWSLDYGGSEWIFRAALWYLSVPLRVYRSLTDRHFYFDLIGRVGPSTALPPDLNRERCICPG